MLGDAEAVVDRAVAAGGIEPGGGAQVCRGNAGEILDGFGRAGGFGDEGGPFPVCLAVAALAHIGLVHQPLGHDHVRHGGEQRDIGARAQRQVVRGLDMRRAHEVDAARVDDDQPGALPQAPLHPAGEDGVPVGRVGADDEDHVRLLDAVEILRARRSAEGGLEAVSGRRVADARAGIDIVVAEALPDQLLDEVGLLVGAAAGGDAADRAGAVAALDAAEFGGDMGDRLVPRNLAPGLIDRSADHRIEDAVAVLGIAPGETAFHAGVAVIGLAFLPGHHAH